MAIIPFTDEQSRALINLLQRYEVWRDAERALRALPYDLRIKTVDGRRYLYEIAGRSGNGRSLGPLNDERQAQYEKYREEKAALKLRRDTVSEILAESGRLARALRTPLLTAEAGAILREADIRGLLDGALLVIGTNCLIAYALEVAGRIDVADETIDFDLAWASREELDGAPVWAMLKAVDPTFTLNSERTFQARNAKAYEVDLLVAPSRLSTLGRTDQPRPIPLPAQEWLLLGKASDQVVNCRDGSSARLVAPDPRWFALHKLWLSRQPDRSPLKRNKDRAQGIAVLDAVAEAMPHYPLDAEFEASIPPELVDFWREWKDARPSTPH